MYYLVCDHGGWSTGSGSCHCMYAGTSGFFVRCGCLLKNERTKERHNIIYKKTPTVFTQAADCSTLCASVVLRDPSTSWERY
jgi:hypothetical protein